MITGSVYLPINENRANPIVAHETKAWLDVSIAPILGLGLPILLEAVLRAERQYRIGDAL